MTKSLVDALRHVMAPSSMKTVLPHYEDRTEQYQMAEEVMHAFVEESVTLIEAGTGTGKSLAYLLPSLLFASERGEPVIIATNTINLQEQLLHKDIPIALQLLQKDLHVVLAKGMGNYVCQEKVRRLDVERSYMRSLPEEEERLYSWCKATASGSRSDLPFRVNAECWDALSADMDTCSTCNCQHSSTCFFLAARRDLRSAHLILTNHHLLLADLVRRVESGNRDELCILPPLKRLIIDEAHHFEDVATEFFAKKASRAEFTRLLSSFFSENSTSKGTKIRNLFAGSKSKEERTRRLDAQETLFSKGRQMQVVLDELFSAVETFAGQVFTAGSAEGERSQRLRLKEAHRSHPLFKEVKEVLVPKAEDSILSFCAIWRDVASSLLLSHNEKKRSIKAELDLACQRLHSSAHTLRNFFMTCGEEGVVHWLEKDHAEGCFSLVQAAFDLSSTLKNHLFSPAQTTVLCSATLSTGKNFDFCRGRLGLNDESLGHPVHTHIYPSPFDYEKHVVFAIPTDIASPDSREYAEQLPLHCAQLIQTSAGGTLILFTSYASMQATFERTQNLLKESPFVLFKQGDQSRRLTIDSFREIHNGVLFATASFWEGIDIPGAALRSVIIAKLPFDVPSDPLAEARAEAMKRRGQNPFVSYSLPRACVKFKQAFGRLIRRKDDRGAVICLDNRLLSKPYGKVFLSSLPPCPVVQANMAEVTQNLKHFFLH